MRRTVGVVVIVQLLAAGSGCMMTGATQFSYWSGKRVQHTVGDEVMIFGGTFWDLALFGGWVYVGITRDPIMLAYTPLALLDLPFCVAADTVLLPMTIPQQIEVLLRDEEPQGDEGELPLDPTPTEREARESARECHRLSRANVSVLNPSLDDFSYFSGRSF